MSRELLGARIPLELKQLVDADSRTNQDIVEAALWDEYGGHRQSALEKRVEHKDRRITQVKKEIEDLQEELATLETEKESLQHQLKEMETATKSYESTLDQLLTAAETGERQTRFIPSTLQDVANEHGKPADEIQSELKQLAIDQERQIRTTMFVSPLDESNIEDGWVADAWGDECE